MFEFSKNILQNVSFNRALFLKELKKAIIILKPDEKNLLKTWCLTTFGHQYGNAITQVFNHFSK